MHHVKNINENGVSHFVITYCACIHRKPLCHKGKRPKPINSMHSWLYKHALRLGLWKWGHTREGQGGRSYPTRYPPLTNVSLPSTNADLFQPQHPHSLHCHLRASLSPSLPLSLPCLPLLVSEPVGTVWRPFQRPLSLKALSCMAQKKSEKLFENY